MTFHFTFDGIGVVCLVFLVSVFSKGERTIQAKNAVHCMIKNWHFLPRFFNNWYEIVEGLNLVNLSIQRVGMNAFTFQQFIGFLDLLRNTRMTATEVYEATWNRHRRRLSHFLAANHAKQKFVVSPSRNTGMLLRPTACLYFS